MGGQREFWFKYKTDQEELKLKTANWFEHVTSSMLFWTDMFFSWIFLHDLNAAQYSFLATASLIHQLS